MRSKRAGNPYLFTFLAALLAAPAGAELFIVRHAERASLSDDASLLSAAGHARAKKLARMLADAPLSAVYCTEYARTCQTAAPAAAARKLAPIKTSSEDVKGLALALRARSREDVLVVGHNDTIPDLLAELGVSTSVVIAKTEFDNLFLVSLSTPARLVRLRY